jgi:radical SAM protein with 4Fe4S-binding SPASM domain
MKLADDEVDIHHPSEIRSFFMHSIADQIKLESHKLTYHPQRVADWAAGKTIYPVYIEVSPSSVCNYRCSFCAYDFLADRTEFIDTRAIRQMFKDVGALGVKSVNFSGQGEPLLHKDIIGIIGSAKKAGLDAAVTTNGTVLDAAKREGILDKLSWIRVSLNAASNRTYTRIHCLPERYLSVVLDNVRESVILKRKNKLNVTISFQYLLIQENYAEVFDFIRRVKDIGVDYVAIKPYCPHPRSHSSSSSLFSEKKLLMLSDQFKKASSHDFKVIFRMQGFKKSLENKAPYKQCLGLPFFAEITTNGDVYPCNSFIGNKDFCFGNIVQQPFQQIWEGTRRRQIMEKISQCGLRHCRKGCRLDEINRYLWDLKHPSSHINFI